MALQLDHTDCAGLRQGEVGEVDGSVVRVGVPRNLGALRAGEGE